MERGVTDFTQTFVQSDFRQISASDECFVFNDLKVSGNFYGCQGYAVTESVPSDEPSSQQIMTQFV